MGTISYPKPIAIMAPSPSEGWRSQIALVALETAARQISVDDRSNQILRSFDHEFWCLHTDL